MLNEAGDLGMSAVSPERLQNRARDESRGGGEFVGNFGGILFFLCPEWLLMI